MLLIVPLAVIEPVLLAGAYCTCRHYGETTAVLQNTLLTHSTLAFANSPRRSRDNICRFPRFEEKNATIAGDHTK